MNSDPTNRDDWTEDQLYYAVVDADWNIGMTARYSQGVVLTFRKHYTSNFPGMEKREVAGTDHADAMRKFLAELDAESADSSAQN